MLISCIGYAIAMIIHGEPKKVVSNSKSSNSIFDQIESYKRKDIILYVVADGLNWRGCFTFKGNDRIWQKDDIGTFKDLEKCYMELLETAKHIETFRLKAD